jgi:rfaE bifunctional protein kinase chain/domain
VSPEAPVPIVNLENRDARLGGAANVALNLQSLGATPILCSVVGNDSEAALLKQLLTEKKMSDKGIVSSSQRATTVKTRVIGNNQQLVRIDSEDPSPLATSDETLFLKAVSNILDQQTVDAVILEDYNKGVLTPRTIEGIISLAKAKQIPIAVDPKKDNFMAYKGVTLFKPNFKELKEGVGMNFTFEQKNLFHQAVEKLETSLGNEITFVTLSEHGVFIKDSKTQHLIPAHLRNITDVSGAGDTVISVATLCLTAGLSIHSIASISNLAGGLVCEISGVVSIDPLKLISESKGKQFE